MVEQMVQKMVVMLAGKMVEQKGEKWVVKMVDTLEYLLVEMKA